MWSGAGADRISRKHPRSPRSGAAGNGLDSHPVRPFPPFGLRFVHGGNAIRNPLITMPSVSFAQNMNDAVLRRALRDVKSGFFIDVCVQSSDFAVSTPALAEQAWRCLHIELRPVYQEQLQGRSPIGIKLRLADATHDGGPATVPVQTLASLWDRHVPVSHEVHFLRIRAESFEHAVLDSGDWVRHRPWIVIVQATASSTEMESHVAWEAILLAASYVFVREDGLDRFYVAQEHRNLWAFGSEATVLDEMAPAPLAVAQARVAALERQLQDVRVQRLRDRRVAVRDLRRLESRFAQRDAAASAAIHRARAVEHAHAALVASVWWRLTSPLRSVVARTPRGVLAWGRRAMKAAWWLVTPWKLPARIRLLRDRARGTLDATPLTVDRSSPELGLYCDDDLASAAGLPAHELFWPPQSSLTIRDSGSAMRWCLQLLRSRSDIRARFPSALTDGAQGDFAKWLAAGDESELGLSKMARARLLECLAGDPSSRARQAFLYGAGLREALPDGLLPSGRRALLRWFVQEGRHWANLRFEEILWLLMSAAERPQEEVMRAYSFSPDWQRRFPDGLTHFGRERFAQWLSLTYGLTGPCLDSTGWPDDLRPQSHIRLSYLARDDWRAAHPNALRNRRGALALMDDLANGGLGLDDAQRAWCRSLNAETVADGLLEEGVNVIGHFSQPCGLQVSACALVDGLAANGVRASLRDIKSDISDEPIHARFGGLEEYGITLIHTQPVPFFEEAYRRSDLHARDPRTFRIAYWYWEFDTIPESWLRNLKNVDEVWAATEFVAKGLREKLPVPVKTLFPGVQVKPFQRRNRSEFGLKDDRFVFLFTFHMNSVTERKNPLGLIEAFKVAFDSEEPVTLVIKTMFAERFPEQLAALRSRAHGWPVTIINATYSEDEALALMDTCDAYVSLHRSEGLGLGMAEAMLMGKPVIATGYSGNLSFMNESNSLLVDYDLVRLEQDLPPYEKGFQWAQPSTSHAALQMRRLFDDPDAARALGERARASATEHLSLARAGSAVARRLREIRVSRDERETGEQPQVPSGINDPLRTQ